MVAVLFDLEGTLVQTIEDEQDAIDEFRAKTRERLVELGIPASELEGFEASTLMRNKAREYVEAHFNEREARRFTHELDRFLKNFELAWAEHSRIFPDTLPALRDLKKTGCKMGIVTNTSREAATRELSMHGIETFFEVMVTREDVKKLKPDPEGILLALKRMNARDFFLIGDLVHDSKVAEKAGGISVIIDRRPLKRMDFHADHVVQSLTEVLGIIEQSKH